MICQQYILMNKAQKSENILNKQKIQNMLKLQELFHNQFLSVELLHQLISLYTTAIQITDDETSPFRNYFLDKIQFVLSRPQILKMLENVNNSQDKDIVETLRETLRITKREQFNHIDPPKENIISNVAYLQKYDGQHETEKKKKIDMQFKVMEEVKVSMKKFSKNIEENQEFKKNRKEKIDGVAKEQNDRLEKRLAMRKKKQKRKASFDDKETTEQEVMNKEDLYQAQKQVLQAVIRITNRVTNRNFLKMQNVQEPQQMRGRIKKSNRIYQ